MTSLTRVRSELVQLQSQLERSLTRTNELLVLLLEEEKTTAESQGSAAPTASETPEQQRIAITGAPITESLSTRRTRKERGIIQRPLRTPLASSIMEQPSPMQTSGEAEDDGNGNAAGKKEVELSAPISASSSAQQLPLMLPSTQLPSASSSLTRPEKQLTLKADAETRIEISKVEESPLKRNKSVIHVGLQKLQSLAIYEKYDDQANSVEMLKDMDAFQGFKGFHPRSLAISVWEVLMSVVLGLLVCFVPMIVTFKKMNSLVIIVSILSTALYIVDSFLKYWTLVEQQRKVAYQNQKVELLSLAESQKKRIVSLMFWLDLIVSVPWNLVSGGRETWLLFLKLIRLWHLPYIVNHNIYHKRLKMRVLELLGVGQAFYSIFILSGILVGFLHINACSLFYFAQAANFPNAPLSLVTNSSVTEQYTASLYLALSNTFPLSYRPSTVSEQWLVIGLVLIGAVIYASIVGTISSFSFGLDASAKLYKQKLDEVNDYMENKRIPEDIRKNVRKYFALKYRGKYFEEASILNELNNSLRHQIALYNLKTLITGVDFLNRQIGDGRDQYFIQRIADALVTCYFVKGDIICSQGDRGNEMYFILNGEVDISIDGKVVKTVKDGQAFGEVAMMAQVARTATATAASHSILYKLQRADFIEIIADFEDVKMTIKNKYHDVLIKAENEGKRRRNTILSRR